MVFTSMMRTTNIIQPSIIGKTIPSKIPEFTNLRRVDAVETVVYNFVTLQYYFQQILVVSYMKSTSTNSYLILIFVLLPY